MTDLMVARSDRNIFISWEHGQKWREMREAILISIPNCENVSKHHLDLLGVGFKG